MDHSYPPSINQRRTATTGRPVWSRPGRAQAQRADGDKGLFERVRLVCTVYDAKTGNYRVDYTLPIQIAGGLTFFVVMMVFFFREWRATRPRARQRQYPRGR